MLNFRSLLWRTKLYQQTSLKEALNQLRIIIGYINRKLPTMTKEIKELHEGIVIVQSRVVTILQVIRDYKKTARDLSEAMGNIQIEINRGIGKKAIKVGDISRITDDIKKFENWDKKLKEVIQEKERKRKGLIVKKTEIKEIVAKLKEMVLNYQLSDDGENADETPDMVKEEETSIINKMMEEEIPKIRRIFC